MAVEKLLPSRAGAPAPVARTPRVATVVLNWNGWADTPECLASLERVREDGWLHHVLVVDNGSTDGSPEAIQRRFPGVALLRNELNLGFAEGMNRGIEWAQEHGFDYVLLLNNDTIVEEGALDRLVDHAVRSGGGAVMPAIRYHGSEEVWHAGARVIRPFFRVQPTALDETIEPYPTEVFTACCVLLSVEALARVGTFDSRYYLYLEDTDLALRLRDAGYATWVVPTAIVEHKVSRSSGGNESPQVLYYLVRNNLVLVQSRAHSAAERWAGYAYVAALSVKIGWNVFGRGLPRKLEILAGIAAAWRDFSKARLGRRA